MKVEKICREIIFGQCPNFNKWSDDSFDCPHCIDKNGKDGFGNQVIDADIAKKILEKINNNNGE